MQSKAQNLTATQFYGSVDEICVNGLKASLNSATRVFDQQLKLSKWCNTYDHYPTEDLTSTAICLIGINRTKLNPEKIGLNYQETLDALYLLAAKRKYLGGFGLLLWANSVCGGNFETLEKNSGQSAQQAVNNISALTTMEAAWLLSGLLHEYRRSGNETLRKFIDLASRELIENRYIAKTRTVAHSGKNPGLIHGLRRWIANFADQIYTVQALAFDKIVMGKEDSLEVSASIASQMIEFQGDLGQWWWHYDAKRGGSPQPYSVYSVHQHGMAPMALQALSEAGGGDYEQAKSSSRNWLFDNEMGCNMIDESFSTIWRSLDYDQGWVGDKTKKIKSLIGVAGDRSAYPKTPALKLNHETRPYEWAWCLYAGAIERSIDSSTHIV